MNVKKGVKKKSDGINYIYEKMDGICKKSEIDKIVNFWMEFCADSLKNDFSIRFSGICTVSVVDKAPAQYRNPKTQEIIFKDAQKRLKFTASEKILDEINREVEEKNAEEA